MTNNGPQVYFPKIGTQSAADRIFVKYKKQIMVPLAGILTSPYAEPDYKRHAYQTIPNDPSLSDLWGLHNTGQTGGADDADIDAPEAWEITKGSPNVIIAVIDTGVDYNHQDLSANMWINPGETPGNGVDDDGNGIVDDVYGMRSMDGNVTGDPMDDHGHGTHCSGTNVSSMLLLKELM